MNQERNLRQIYRQIDLFRLLALFLVLFSLIQLVLATILPDLLPVLLKTWLIVVAGSAFLGIALGLFLGRKDPSTVLFFSFLATFIGGLISGISLVAIVAKVKN